MIRFIRERLALALGVGFALLGIIVLLVPMNAIGEDLRNDLAFALELIAMVLLLTAVVSDTRYPP